MAGLPGYKTCLAHEQDLNGCPRTRSHPKMRSGSTLARRSWTTPSPRSWRSMPKSCWSTSHKRVILTSYFDQRCSLGWVECWACCRVSLWGPQMLIKITWLWTFGVVTSLAHALPDQPENRGRVVMSSRHLSVRRFTFSWVPKLILSTPSSIDFLHLVLNLIPKNFCYILD